MCKRGRVDMCQMDLRDPDSDLPVKLSSGIEVNDPYWCACLEAGAQCRHVGQRHQAVEGALHSGEPRMDWAARWTTTWSRRLLQTAQKVLETRRQGANEVPLHAPCPETGQWEAVPVEVEHSPEGLLRQRLGEVTGQRFDYVYFEGLVVQATAEHTGQATCHVGPCDEHKTQEDAVLERGEGPHTECGHRPPMSDLPDGHAPDSGP